MISKGVSNPTQYEKAVCLASTPGNAENEVGPLSYLTEKN